ncbi:uncharacterized protein LOC111595120 [Drosophila hydei]|uniref:Uncharacterized protein LOC111595120 n=1 Tax=Drosophila hydei TaxID=7224 RepID=A0A6J1LC92_DROHY|nr:uncharacterized protein LOC111595120 [Drosophila hydei]
MRKSLGIDIRLLIVAAVALWLSGDSICRIAATDEFPECDGIASGSYINNTRANCNYSLIYCDEDSSQFCDRENSCDLEYSCGGQNSSTLNPSTPPAAAETTTATESSNSSSSGSTAAPGTDVRGLCRRGVTKKYLYPGNCNYYYYCVDGFLIVEQCPIGYAFNEQLGTCSGRIADQLPRTCTN